MKYSRKNIILSTVFVFVVFFSYAQPGGPPSGGGEGASNQVGGDAPIGGGIMILLVLGAVYGAKKVFKLVSESEGKLEE